MRGLKMHPSSRQIIINGNLLIKRFDSDSSLWKRRYENGVKFPYLYKSGVTGMVKKPEVIEPFHKKRHRFLENFPVIFHRDYIDFAKKGDIKYVRRSFYRYHLLEADVATPLSEEMVWNSPELMEILKTEYEPINTDEVREKVFAEAKEILEKGVLITFELNAPWIITPFHMAKILSFKTGFDIEPQHVKMEQSEIRNKGKYIVQFKHENGIEATIPVTIAILNK